MNRYPWIYITKVHSQQTLEDFFSFCSRGSRKNNQGLLTILHPISRREYYRAIKIKTQKLSWVKGKRTKKNSSITQACLISMICRITNKTTNKTINNLALGTWWAYTQMRYTRCLLRGCPFRQMFSSRIFIQILMKIWTMSWHTAWPSSIGRTD